MNYETIALESIAKILRDAKNSAETGEVSDGAVLDQIYEVMDNYTGEQENKMPKYRVYARRSVELVTEVEATGFFEALSIARGKDSLDFDEVPMSDAFEVIDAALVE